MSDDDNSSSDNEVDDNDLSWRQLRERKVNKEINDEFKTWRMNTKFLYDLVIIHALDWPSPTVQWMPDKEEPPGKDYTLQKMILGTHATHDEPNHLLIAEVKLPLDDYDDVEKDVPEGSGGRHDDDDAGDSAPTNKVQIIQQINHDGAVHVARYMPQKPNIIATKTTSAEVYVFDTSKHPSKAPLDGEFKPDLRLRGHTEQGLGLTWSPLQQGHLLSASDDAQICLWDINETPTDNALDTIRVHKKHEGPVNDVAWHCSNENLFGSVGEDQFLHIWDLRTLSLSKPIHSVVAHQSEVYCLAFNPYNEWIVVTGSKDHTVKLFDTRKIDNCVHTFKHHKDEITQVGWSPHSEVIFASSCLGRRLLVWDLSKLGQEQTAEEAEEGPPELLFLHGGHTSKVSDFSWNPSEEWVIASVAGDNIVQIWQMQDEIYLDDDNAKNVGSSAGNS